MKDQVGQLTRHQVQAVAVGPDTPQDIIKDVPKGKYSIVFLSPEMAMSRQWRSIFLSDVMSSKLCLLACDEAHCVSEWGNDFQPQYKEFLLLRSIIEAPLVALTATCDEKIRKDIFQTLELIDGTLTVAALPDRPNIYLDIRSAKQDHEKDLLWLKKYLISKQHNALKIIVYCRSVNQAATLYNYLKDELIPSNVSTDVIDLFHRSIDEHSCNRILEQFKCHESEIRFLLLPLA